MYMANYRIGRVSLTFHFWAEQLFRQRFPQFDQRTPQGAPMQQDAEECLSQILQVMADNVTEVPDHLKIFNPSAKNAVDAIFGTDLTYT